MNDINLSKEYYDVKDIMAKTGYKKSKCYDIIRRLNERFNKEFPSSIIMRGKIPIWYFKKIMRCEELDEYGKKRELNHQVKVPLA